MWKRPIKRMFVRETPQRNPGSFPDVRLVLLRAALTRI